MNSDRSLLKIMIVPVLLLPIVVACSGAPASDEANVSQEQALDAPAPSTDPCAEYRRLLYACGVAGIAGGIAGTGGTGGPWGGVVWGSAALATCLADKGLTGNMYDLATQCGINMIPPAPPTPPTQCAQAGSLAECRSCCTGVEARCLGDCVGIDGLDGACADRCRRDGQTYGSCFDRCVENMSK